MQQNQTTQLAGERTQFHKYQSPELGCRCALCGEGLDHSNHRSRETVGRTYKRTTWGIHSRRVGGDGKWYGSNNYKSLKECLQYLRNVGKPFDLGGGFTMTFPAGKDLFEYRIIRLDSECTVEHVEDQLV